MSEVSSRYDNFKSFKYTGSIAKHKLFVIDLVDTFTDICQQKFPFFPKSIGSQGILHYQFYEYNQTL